jgi:hypothetical protein
MVMCSGCAKISPTGGVPSRSVDGTRRDTPIGDKDLNGERRSERHCVQGEV